jgi:hypothetical protein
MEGSKSIEINKPIKLDSDSKVYGIINPKENIKKATDQSSGDFFPNKKVNYNSQYSMNNNLDLNSAITITQEEFACYHITQYILRSHDRLNEDDIQYASDYISSFYAYSQSVKDINLLDTEQLILFLVYADQRGIGKFALIFNEELENSIKIRNNGYLKNIILGPKDMFIELYDNPYLSVENRQFIIRLLSREKYSLNLTFELIKKKIVSLDEIETRCNSQTMTLQAENNNGMVNVAVLMNRCYDEVCLEDTKILNQDFLRGIMSKHEINSDSIYTVDKSKNFPYAQKYCFGTIDLIALMTEEIPINPISGEPFSDFSIKIVRQRFNKEISMYRRYKEIRSK